MNGKALQHEFTSLRTAGMKPREALNSMIDWRRQAASSLVGGGYVPACVSELALELAAEIERLQMTRKFSGVRP
jgi:xanthine/CO dehydrogenase XdhC/CoxF family maturation factor